MEELLDELEKSLANVELNENEMRCMSELREYALGPEGRRNSTLEGFAVGVDKLKIYKYYFRVLDSLG